MSRTSKQTKSARAARVYNEWYYKYKKLDPMFDDEHPTPEQEAEYEAMMKIEFSQEQI